MSLAYKHISTVTSVAASPAGHVLLHRIVINKGTATAVVTVYDGTSTAGNVVAVIDAATKMTHDFGGVRLPGGLFVDQTVAASDVTIVYE